MKRIFQVIFSIGAVVLAVLFYRDIMAKNSGESKNLSFILQTGDSIKFVTENPVSVESYGTEWYRLLNQDEKVKPDEYAGGFTKSFNLKGTTLEAIQGKANFTFKSDLPFQYTVTLGDKSNGEANFGTFLMFVVFLLVAVGGPELIDLFAFLLGFHD